MNKLILAILLLLPVAANAQRISALGTTNVAAGTNVIALVVAPNVTNGTRQIRVDNLFSNRTISGFVVLTNLNGYTVAGTVITNYAGNATNLFTIPLKTSQSVTLSILATFIAQEITPGVDLSGGFSQVAVFQNLGGTVITSGGTTNLLYNTGASTGTNGFVISGTNVLVRAYSGTYDTKWRARLEVLHSPP